MEWGDFLNFFISLLAISNPIGSLAIFMTLTNDESTAEQRKTALTIGFAVCVVLIVVLWLGNQILGLFNISISSFQIAGGIILLALGFSMLRARHDEMSRTEKEQSDAMKKDSVALIPMTIPMTAGPAAMTAVIIHGDHFSGAINKLYLSLGIIAVGIVIGVLFYFADVVRKRFGATGIRVTTRLMGLILMAIAVNMFAEGISGLFPILKMN